MRLSDVIGQKEIMDYFRKSKQSDHLQHAYLLEGEKGMGKKTLVNALVTYLLCDNPQGEESCGQCSSCIQMQSGNHPDVIYVESTKKTGYGVEDIREQIVDTVSVKPYQSKYKIYIIANAETITVPAQNILLKTIEEPPTYAMFFFLTENREKMLVTVLSRVVLLRLKPLNPEELGIILQKNGLAHRQSEIIFASGNAGKLLQIAASDEFLERKRDLENLLDIFIKSTEYDIIKGIKILEKYEEDLANIFSILQILIRERLKKQYMEQTAATSEVSRKYYGLARNLLQAKRQLASNVNKSLILWNLFLI